MKNKIYLIFVLAILATNFVVADEWPICIDLKIPSTPTGLQVSGNLQLSWTASTDTPDCSGIDYYNIYKDGSLLDISSSTSYSGNALPDGTYILGVGAVDKVGNKGGVATLEVTFPLSSTTTTPPSSGGGGGGGSSSSSSGGGGGGGSSSGTTTLLADNTASTSGSEEVEETSEIKESETETTKSTNFLTGAVIGFAKTGAGIGTIIVLIIIVAGIGVMYVNKKKNPNNSKNAK